VCSYHASRLRRLCIAFRHDQRLAQSAVDVVMLVGRSKINPQVEDGEGQLQAVEFSEKWREELDT
jgi:hypothetical protein